MRQKRVTRYYCDHCNKGSLTRASMERHEKGCTLNKARVCDVCERFELTQKPIAELIAAAKRDSLNTSDLGHVKPDELRIASEGCPACMMAGIKGLREEVRASEEFEDERGDRRYFEFDFDFKSQMAEMYVPRQDHF